MTSLSMTPAPPEQQGTHEGRQQQDEGQRSSTRTRTPQADIALYSPRGCAAPGSVPGQGNTQERLSKLEAASSQRKIVVTCKSPVGDISAVTLIRTDTTLDHSQKAEKVCLSNQQISMITMRLAAKHRLNRTSALVIWVHKWFECLNHKHVERACWAKL